MIQLPLQGLDNYHKFFFSGSPKVAITPRQQEVNLKIQHPHSQKVGWVLFDHSMGYGYLSLRAGYKLLLVIVRKKVEQRRLHSEFMFWKKRGVKI